MCTILVLQRESIPSYTSSWRIDESHSRKILMLLWQSHPLHNRCNHYCPCNLLG
jgi:hypothetical protein